jgi:repressor LexA
MQELLKLTGRQHAVLSFFNESVRETGTPPTIREVMRRCGLKSPRGAELQLRALAVAGYVIHEPGRTPAYRPRLTHGGSIVPILGRAPAGHPSDQLEDPDGFLPIPWRFGERAYAIRVDGDSMRDAHIVDGDLVVVKRTGEARHGDIVVAMIDGKHTIKRLQLRGTAWTLKAENPDYPPIVPRMEGDQVVGRVVALVRKLAAN